MPPQAETDTEAAALPEELSEEVQLRGLPWILAQNGLNAAFAYLTVFGSVFLLFLSELGLPKGQIGLLLSLLPLSGLLALGFAPVATRLGRRRVFMICWTARKLAVASLLALPWVMERLGHTAGLIYLIAAVASFAVLRALAETAWYPWSQEIVPDRVRGRFGANSTVVCTIASCAVLLVAGRVIQSGTGVEQFLLLIGVGCLLGLVGVLVMLPVAGGKPQPLAPTRGQHLHNMGRALHDSNFVLYLAGLGCFTVGSVLYLSFLPLFLKERLGVPAGTVVTLDISVMVGGALSALLWGRAADRVGSRPVLMIAAALTCLIPLGWLLLPRQVPHLVLWCAILYFVQGIAANGGAIGSGRLLFNDVIPPRQNTAYTALYYSCLGLTGGVAPLLAGFLLQALDTAPWHLGWLTVDVHTLLFGLALVLISAGWICYAKVRPDDRYRTRDVIHSLSERLLRCLPW